MAAHERRNSQTSIPQTSLPEQLAEALPKGSVFKIYHVSTPPIRSPAIYSAPTGERPDKTYRESHFLAVSITPTGGEVLVYAIEVLIYSTAFSTTFFISKADSSGYLHLLKLPRGVSPIKEVSTAFLTWIVQRRRRPGIPSIVSLFARAQDQYLFPGSVKNNDKHVLDDRGLIKWWCRVLDPLTCSVGWRSAGGFLIVPGDDNAVSYLPNRTVWTIGHPLNEISRHQNVFPRCLVPHFPDDPKARYLDELDDDGEGEWKSVRTLDQFWEMMAFRQECSSGRLVGFIWVVFRPDDDAAVIEDSQRSFISQGSEAADDVIQQATSSTALEAPSVTERRLPTRSPTKPHPVGAHDTSKRKQRLTGTVVPRKPRVKTDNGPLESTPYYFWPADSRGQLLLEEKDYRRMDELLLVLEFGSLELAREGTRRWVNEGGDWGLEVIGQKELAVVNVSEKRKVNDLGIMVRKKPKT